MDQLYIIHGFERESTFLVDVPASVLQEPIEAIEFDRDHDRFVRALTFPTGDLKRPNNAATELSVMQVAPINASKGFHRRFLEECSLYCRLRQRLQRAAEWLFAGIPTNSSAARSQQFPCDVDGLSNAVHPLEPTAFAAAAFALPSLLSIAPAQPHNVEVARAASIAPITTIQPQGEGGTLYGASNSAQNVPYCLFYPSIIPSVSYSSTPPLTTRFSAVAMAAWACSVVSSSDYTLCSNRSKSGLSLSAYLEGRLPRSACNGLPTIDNVDPFTLWSDDVLWRLLSSLISALAVVHASGMHYRGELTANDVLCFALPNDVRLLPHQNDLSVGQSRNTAGRRIAEWAASTRNRWVITGSTPAHQAYFMISALPSSIFSDDSRIPVDVIIAQRRDVASLGRLLMSVFEERKRRRADASPRNVPGSSASCSELLFVTERMTTAEDSGAVLAGEAPAHRFAQLQAIRLRTQLWLLRATVEEQQAQLAAEFCRRGRSPSHPRDSGRNETSPPRLLSSARATPNPSYPVDITPSEAKIRERERLLTEREEKLNRFLELYELTAERLDELPIGKEGYNQLKKSLRLKSFETTSTTRASPTSRRRLLESPQSPSPQVLVPLPASPPVDVRVGPPDGHLRFSRREESPPAIVTSTSTATITSAAVPSAATGAAFTPRDAQPLSAKSKYEEKAMEKPWDKRFENPPSRSTDKPWDRSLGKPGERTRDRSAHAQRGNLPISTVGIAVSGTRVAVAAAAAAAMTTTAAATTAAPASTGTANRTASMATSAKSRSPSLRLLHTNWRTLSNALSSDINGTTARFGLPCRPRSGSRGLSAKTVPSQRHAQQCPTTRGHLTPPQQTRRSPVSATVNLSPELTPAVVHTPPARGSATPPETTPLRQRAAAASGETPQHRTPPVQSWRQVHMSPTLGSALRNSISPRYLNASTPRRQKDHSPTAAGARSTPWSRSQRRRSGHIPDANDSISTRCRSTSRLGASHTLNVSCTPVRVSPRVEVSTVRDICLEDTTEPRQYRPSQQRGRISASALGGDTPEPGMDGENRHRGRKAHGNHAAAAERHRNDCEKTLRTARSRVADNGWIDNQLAALEQLRCDFLQSEAQKSARTTPNGKALRGSRALRISPDSGGDYAAAAYREETGAAARGRAMCE